MRRFAPSALGGRLALLLVLAVVAAQVAALVLFASESTRVGRAAARTQVVERVATLVRLLAELPADTVPGVLAAYGSPRQNFALGDTSVVPQEAMDADEARLAHGLERRLRAAASPARLRLVENAPGPNADGRPSMPDVLRVSVRLKDGRWLNGEAQLTLPTPPWVRIGLYQLGASLVAVLAVAGIAMRGIVGPVTALAAAAEKVGRGASVPPLPARGPRELRTLITAFNEMQARLRAYVNDRTRMLAAISHDLRTPIASLWLRAEMVEDVELRTAMVRTLGEMKRMVEATLSFARDDAAAQRSERVDLADTARSLVDDHCALGRDVALSAPDALTLEGRPVALRRALDNLIENAVRYGERARVSLDRDDHGVRIRVEDDGPGIPEDRLEEMFAPFTRLDGSRSDETGGLGLGLAIARSAIRAHGGDIRFTNLPVWGLRAEIVLPTTKPA